tara:strand:+ start:1263 stop:1616 length:354 start_codon:yes stop_codon:yes gene_type:complete
MKESLATILANEDKMMVNLAGERRRQKDNLKKNYEELKKNKKHNPYLEIVFGEYSEHYDNKKKEKEQQYNALQELLDYMDEVDADEKLSVSLQNECKNDKHMLLREMIKLRTSINKL